MVLSLKNFNNLIFLPLLSLLLILFSECAFAYPPFITDDATTMEAGEAYAALIAYTNTSKAVDYIQAPLIEFDFAVLSNLEVDTYTSFTTNLSTSEPDSFAKVTGISDLLIEIKYRFNQETDSIPKFAFAPQITLPTGAVRQGLGYGRSTYYLPINVEKNFGDWKTYGQAGYNVFSIPGLHKYISGGWGVEKNVNENLMLGAELFYTEGFDYDLNPPYILLNIGGSYYFTKKNNLIVGIGHSVWGDKHWSIYLGVGVG